MHRKQPTLKPSYSREKLQVKINISQGHNEVEDSDFDLVESQFDFDTCNSNAEAYVELGKDNLSSEKQVAKVLKNQCIMNNTKHIELRRREFARKVLLRKCQILLIGGTSCHQTRMAKTLKILTVKHFKYNCCRSSKLGLFSTYR